MNVVRFKSFHALDGQFDLHILFVCAISIQATYNNKTLIFQWLFCIHTSIKNLSISCKK